jgi:hypothetical protein
MRRRLPASYFVALAVIAAIGVVVALIFYSVPPFDNLQVFILANVIGFFALLVLGVIGGAFVGMLLAHRMLGNREFSPFEQNVLRALEDVRERLERLEKREGLERPPRP